MPHSQKETSNHLHLESYPLLLSSLTVFPDVPSPAMLGIERERDEAKMYTGGERQALKYFARRIKLEKETFLSGTVQLPQCVEILLGPHRRLEGGER